MTAAYPIRTADWDDEVLAFLQANPDWLAAHPGLYRVLTPPARIHGDVMADHMAAMIWRERRHASAMTEQMETVLAARRAAATMLARLHEAVLTLITADDITDCLANELPRILAVDAVCLCRRDGTATTSWHANRLDGLLGTRDVLFRTRPADATSLYREAAGLAQNDVLIRLPALGVLGLASRNRLWPEAQSLQVGLQFLGRAVAAILTPKINGLSNWAAG